MRVFDVYASNNTRTVYIYGKQGLYLHNIDCKARRRSHLPQHVHYQHAPVKATQMGY